MLVPLIRLFRIASFPFFLVSFIFSFFIPQLYKDIVFVQFMVIAPLVALINYNFRSVSQTAQLLFILFTVITIAFGVPGSALGYVISASIGLFAAHKVLSKKAEDEKMEYFLYLVAFFCFITASLYLISANYRSAFSFDQTAEYFGQASINYASLTVASFCSIFATWCAIRQLYHFNDSPKKVKLLRIISGILAVCIFGLAVIFSTRSAIIGFVPPFLYAIQPKRPYLYLLALLVIIIAVYFLFPVFAEFVLMLIVPGRESLLDLYDSELKGQERSEAAFVIFEKALPYMSVCIKCSDYMSFSGLSNLVALSFPFSLFYLFQLIRFMFKYVKAYLFPQGTNKLLILIIGVSFLNSLMLALFQADFLSMVSLFYVIGTGLALFKTRKIVFKRFEEQA